MRVGGLWLLLSWALLMLGRSSAPARRGAPTSRSPSAPRRSRSPGIATCCANEPLTARMAPVDARVDPLLRATVMLAFLVGVLPLLVLFVTGGRL